MAQALTIGQLAKATGVAAKTIRSSALGQTPEASLPPDPSGPAPRRSGWSLTTSAPGSRICPESADNLGASGLRRREFSDRVIPSY